MKINEVKLFTTNFNGATYTFSLYKNRTSIMCHFAQKMFSINSTNNKLFIKRKIVRTVETPWKNS